MTLRLSLTVLAAVVELGGCRSQTIEPAPPPASYELVMAPPGARGARAAGTDAAPAAPNEGELAEPAPGEEEAPEPEPEPEPEEDGGGSSDAGPPDAGPGVAL